MSEPTCTCASSLLQDTGGVHEEACPVRQRKARGLTTAPAALAEGGKGTSGSIGLFQTSVREWLLECFGGSISHDKLERGDRFVEEALELLQSGGFPEERVAALVEYVWSRPKGEASQEVGGVCVTLAAYCFAHGIDLESAAQTELTRITQPEIVAKIRAKQAAKPTGSALPVRSESSEARAKLAATEAENARLRDIIESATEELIEFANVSTPNLAGTPVPAHPDLTHSIHLLRESYREKIATLVAENARLKDVIRERVEAKREYDTQPEVTCRRCGEADKALEAIIKGDVYAASELREQLNHAVAHLREQLATKDRQLDALASQLAMAEDAAAKGELARQNAGGMEIQIGALEAQLAAVKEAKERNQFADSHLPGIISDHEEELARIRAELSAAQQDGQAMREWMSKKICSNPQCTMLDCVTARALLAGTPAQWVSKEKYDKLHFTYQAITGAPFDQE